MLTFLKQFVNVDFLKKLALKALLPLILGLLGYAFGLNSEELKKMISDSSVAPMPGVSAPAAPEKK